MKVERTQNVFGFEAAVTITVPETIHLSPGMQARLEHHTDLALRRVAARIAWHVIDWPKRQAILLRMPLDEAKLLGLLTEWRKAKAEKPK